MFLLGVNNATATNTAFAIHHYYLIWKLGHMPSNASQLYAFLAPRRTCAPDAMMSMTQKKNRAACGGSHRGNMGDCMAASRPLRWVVLGRHRHTNAPGSFSCFMDDNATVRELQSHGLVRRAYEVIRWRWVIQAVGMLSLPYILA